MLRKVTRYLFLFLFVCGCLLGTAKQTEAATNVVTVAKQNNLTGGLLITDQNGVRYQNSDQTFVKKKWASVDGKIYRFSDQGYAMTGWFTFGKKRYYADESGVVYVKKWLTEGKSRYYLQKDGSMASEKWIKWDGSYYYLKKDGTMARSCLISCNGKHYYVSNTGKKLINAWVTRNGKRYFFGKYGVRYEKKWILYKDRFYYLNSSGVMEKNCWKGSYYLGSDGARVCDAYAQGCYFGSDGLAVRGTTNSYSYLFVGDSRTVGMSMSVSSSKQKNHYIGKVGEGYQWLITSAGPQAEKLIAGNEELKVIFGFGINDMGNVSSYLSYYSKLIKKFPKAMIYLMSVNPINDSVASQSGYLVRNQQVIAFNKKMKAAFPDQYLDSYTYLKKNGFHTSDGIHYSSDTYVSLYNWILKNT